MREWALPPCLHVPIVAIDEAAIHDHIGEIVSVLSPGRALLVAVDPPPDRDFSLPIWEHPNVENLFEPLQVWVSPTYTRYRPAYRRAKGDAAVEGAVLHHVYNRRSAVLRGFGFIRLVPISRRANSSSSFTEQWGVSLNTPERIARLKARNLKMQFADLGDLMAMLDIDLGGGVQEAMRLGQNLVEPRGLRPPQG